MFEKIKQYWAIGFVAVTIASVAFSFYALQGAQADVEKKMDDLEKAQNTLEETQFEQVKLAQKINDQFDIILTLAGFDKEKIDEWKAIPKTPPVDSLDNIIIGAQWILITEDMKVGILMERTDDTTFSEVVLWNFIPEGDSL